MYGLKQASIIAYLQLAKNMDGHGYYPTPCTTGLWAHHTLENKFCLYVDDLGIKYLSKDKSDHLLNVIK